jgi:hypothetical protein
VTAADVRDLRERVDEARQSGDVDTPDAGDADGDEEQRDTTTTDPDRELSDKYGITET